MTDRLIKLEGLIRDLFDEYQGPVTRSLKATDVPQWDSLGHVQLMVLVEQSFGVRFSAGEIGRFHDLGDLADEIDRKSQESR
ncbi:MAG TPA: acyl carrier protein [Micropepsaceae bacterium]|nr:acyl carrier protein [Micropepsaceae bacterium]